jgi:hypothetical protein
MRHVSSVDTYLITYSSRRKARRIQQTTEEEPLIAKDHVIHDVPSPMPAYIQYPLLTILVIATGFFAWYLQSLPVTPGEPNRGAGGPVGHRHHRRPHKSHGVLALLDTHHPLPDKVELEWRSQVLGWSSAVLYLGSRVPQIVHNTKTRCEGLSLAMFFFSISGSELLISSENGRKADQHKTGRCYIRG